MRKITFDEFYAWTQSQSGIVAEEAFLDESDEFEDEGVQFHKGDLTVDNLMIGACLVVEGNLTVTGNIRHEYDVGLLVVTGNLTCQEFTFSLTAVIAGNLIADVVDVNSLNDYSLHVGGDLIAQSVTERGHYTVVRGEIKAPLVRSMMNEIRSRSKVYPRVPYVDKDDE
jgi:hypothetical protein